MSGSSRLSHLRSPLIVLLTLAVIGIPITAAARAEAAALAAGLGLMVVGIFFTLSSLAVAWADRIHPTLTLPIALMTYLGKVVILALLLAGLRTTPLDLPAFAAAIIVGVFGWLGAVLWPVLRSRERGAPDS
ncbi:MAG: hypothetical protein ACR2F6_10005 [Mycobacteriales bacterium]